MKNKLLWALAVSLTSFSLLSAKDLQEHKTIKSETSSIPNMRTMVSVDLVMPRTSSDPLNNIKNMLLSQAKTLNRVVIDKVLTTLECANENNVRHNHILTVIDYSLPSSEKRLWVFDLNQMKLLFNTYVSHGIKSGAWLTNNFSNKFNSKASSIGVYKTDQTYYGRDGLSLRLTGLEQGFNDNASNRYVVMHGGWYVTEDFIKKYGRAGRSWGCPAVPLNLTAPIINTIKDNSLFVVYYPSDNWFLKSKFLNCNIISVAQNIANLTTELSPIMDENDKREDILFVDIHKNNRRDEYAPIVVMSADNYEHVFHSKAPLGRMLRRQIDHAEYIALSSPEFKTLATNHDGTLNNEVHFVIPVIKEIRGYYETQMKIVNLGKIKEVTMNSDGADNNAYTVHFEEKPMVNLRTTNQFIRWLGL